MGAARTRQNPAAASTLFRQVLSCFLFQFPPDRIRRALRTEKPLQIAVQRVHFPDGVHGVVADADLPEARRAQELEKAQTGLAIGRALELLVAIGQDLVSRVAEGAVALNVGVDQPVQTGRVAPEPFQVAVRFVAREGRGEHKGRVAQKIVPMFGS